MRRAATIVLLIITSVLLLILFNLFRPSQDPLPVATVRYSDFIRDVNDGKLRSVVIEGSILTGRLADGHSYRTYLPDDPTLITRLLEKAVQILAKPADDFSILHYALSWLPFLVFTAMCVSVIYHVRKAASKMTLAVETLCKSLPPPS